MRPARLAALAFLAAACGGRAGSLDPRIADGRPALADDSAALVGGHRAVELALRGFVARERGEHDEAEGMLRQALEHDPGDAGLLVEHARTLRTLGRDAEARQDLGRALEADPSDEAAWLLLAELERDAGRDAESLEAARRGMRAEPRGIEAALWLAARLLERNETSGAEDLLAGVLARRPYEPRAHLALADARLVEGDVPGALLHLRRVAELTIPPGPAVAERVRGAAGDVPPGQAAELLEIAVAAGGAGPEIRLELVRLLVADGRLGTARRHLEALPPPDPGDAAARRERAELLLAAGDPWEARRVLLEEPQATLADPAARRLLAGVETALGRSESAAALAGGR